MLLLAYIAVAVLALIFAFKALGKFWDFLAKMLDF